MSALGQAPAVEFLSEDLQPVWRLTVEQYHEMMRAGILLDGDPVELLEGVLVAKMSKKPAHRRGSERSARMLAAAIPDEWYVADQQPITLPRSEPEPDLAVIRGSTDDYPDRHPSPAEVALVAEVADTSLARDRRLKLRMYAESGIPTYWVLNVIEMQLEVHTKPVGTAYTAREIRRAGETVTFWLDGVESGPVAVTDLLPL